MKKVHYSTTLFASALVASLLLAPSSVSAEIFGYAGIKAGYSHQSADRLDLISSKSGNADTGIFLNSFSLSSLPLGANAGLGYYFTPSFGFRIEAEYLYRVGLNHTLPAIDRRNNQQARPVDPNAKISIDTQTLLGNFYLDYYATPSVNLYLSAGVGMGILSTKLSVTEWAGGAGNQAIANNTTQISKNSLAWQVGLGMGYAITQNFGLDFNARYVGLGKLKSGINLAPTAEDAKGEASTSAIEALIGLNFRF